MKFPRLAVRAVIVEDGRLLLVNAYGGEASDLWCAPGGGVEAGASLPDNLAREVFEETGLRIAVGGMLAINEFKAPDDTFHQVEVFFRARVTRGDLSDAWEDPENVVNKRRFFERGALGDIRLKPDFLRSLPFEAGAEAHYDPLELIVR